MYYDINNDEGGVKLKLKTCKEKFLLFVFTGIVCALTISLLFI